MSEPVLRPVILDATVLSNFASTESVTWLLSTINGLTTVPAVERELRQGVNLGHNYLSDALKAVERDQIEVYEDAPEQLERSYSDIRDRLDPGEAEAFVAADRTGGTLVTDDGAARSLASASDIHLTGSIGLLVRGVVRGDLSVGTADNWLTTWINERGYYAPVDSVSEVLPEDSD